MRIAKFIANAGLCSRRDAEKWILSGHVMIDDQVITSAALNINAQHTIKVKGKIIDNALPKPRLWAYYKPIGMITTHNDPQNRPTIFQYLHDKLPRVISVGRLDINSEGLILLTNSGDLSAYFESPINRIKRTYKVRVFGRAKEVSIHNKSIEIDGVIYKPNAIELIKKSGLNSWYKVVLHEGKNREIRKIFEYYGLRVNRLIRTNFGTYNIHNMKPNDYKEQVIDEDYLRKI